MKNDFDPGTWPAEPELDLKPYLALALHWAWLFVLAALVGGAAGYFHSRRQTPVYASSTTVMIDTAPTTRAADYSSIHISERLSQTYSKLISTQPIIGQVRKEMNREDLGVMGISVSPIRNTQLMNITVEHTDPKMAAEIANTLVRVFGREIVNMQSARYAVSKTNLQAQVVEIEAQIEETTNQLQKSTNALEKSNLETKRTQYRQIYGNMLMSLEQVRLAEAQTISSIIQVEPARMGYKIRPRVRRTTMLAALLGLLTAAAFVFGLHFLDTTVRNPDVLSRRFGLPILGTIATHETKPGEVIAVKHPRSPVTEAFRALRTNVRFTSPDRPLRRLIVTSPTPQDGKTTVATNLAVVLAQNGEQVVLIDADMRRPMVHKTLGLRNSVGLSGLFMQDAVEVEPVLTPTGVPGLRAVLTGSLPPNPSELLGSKKMKEILDHMLETNDTLIIDTPPVMSVTDAVILANKADGVLLVFRPGSTKTSALIQAVEQLRLVNANLIGMVANNVNLARGGYNTYYYRRYYTKYAYYSEDHQRGWRAKVRRTTARAAQRVGLKKKA